MKLNLNSNVRAVIYLIGVVGTILVTYLLGKGLVGTDEQTMWNSLVAAIFVMAGLNVNKE